MPVWQGIQSQICMPPFELSIPKINNDIAYGLAWSVDSLGMSQKRGGALLSVNNNQAAIVAAIVDVPQT